MNTELEKEAFWEVFQDWARLDVYGPCLVARDRISQYQEVEVVFDTYRKSIRVRKVSAGERRILFREYLGGKRVGRRYLESLKKNYEPRTLSDE